MKLKRIVALCAAMGVALSGVALTAAPANAEPVANSYSIVGSDTLESVVNALVNGTTVTGPSVRITTSSGSIGNFDAFGSSQIQTKSYGAYFTRPNGSGAGRDALRASMWVSGNTGSNQYPASSGKVVTGLVDIARSSGGPGTNADANGKLTYVPFARDAVAYAYKGGTAAWANLSVAQLKAIYDGTLTSIDGVAVKPRLPQAGSGTRNFFLNQLGYAGSAPTAPAVSDTGNSTPENDATVLAAGEIIPFSVAQWVAQGNGLTNANTTTATGVLLGSGVAGVVPVTGTAPNLVPNAAYYNDATFGRDTYLIVERARVTTTSPTYDAKLAGLVDSTKVTSLTNFSTALPSQPGSIKQKFGFLAPKSATPIPAYPNG